MKKNVKLVTIAAISAVSLFGCRDFHDMLPNGGGNGCSSNSTIYECGDFHQHSTFTDGSWSIAYVMEKNNAFGLDWWANSEHGGGFNRDGRSSGKDIGTTLYWDEVPSISILGTNATSGGHQIMWRWQSIRDFSFPELLQQRKLYPHKTIIQGYEWNVPGHEHASVSIVANEFGKTANAKAISEFEYKFDNNDNDITGGQEQGWIKSSNSGHAKTIEAIQWLQKYYANTSWVVPAHPERKSLYSIADFRDMNNAGPDVCFGFESMPGHQKSSDRGEYKASSKTYGNCTYGGTGLMAAKIGGLWDAMLTEGRRWWLFSNSDFHDIANDFYPGEYQKTYVAVKKRNDAQSIANGLRSGNSYVVCGNLIEELEFNIDDANMGETCNTNKNYVTLSIKIKKNNLNHIDLIAGEVKNKISASSAEYAIDTVSTTRVIARFDANGGIKDDNGIISEPWINHGNNWIIIYTKIPVKGKMYFRLRGTNWGINEPNQTDGNGNPLPDTLESPNTAEKAMSDLWFYSNPIFVKTKK